MSLADKIAKSIMEEVQKAKNKPESVDWANSAVVWVVSDTKDDNSAAFLWDTDVVSVQEASPEMQDEIDTWLKANPDILSDGAKFDKAINEFTDPDDGSKFSVQRYVQLIPQE